MTIKTKSRDSAGLWWLLPLSVLIIALAARIVASTADALSYDAYAMMNGVEKTFLEYKDGLGGSYGLPLMVHYWLSYRIFGNSLSGYLVLPLLLNLAALIVVAWGLYHYWRSNKGLCFFTLAILAFNDHSLYLASYPVFNYAASFLVASLLYLLFLQLSYAAIPKRYWLWITLFTIPVAFFTNLTILVPVAVGMFCTAALRLWRSRSRLNLSYIWQSLKEFSPTLIFPLTQVVIFIIHTPTNITPDKRPDMAPLFFYSSSFPQSLSGAAQFLINNSASLFASLLFPSNINGAPKPFWIGLGVFIAVIVVWFLIRLFSLMLSRKQGI